MDAALAKEINTDLMIDELAKVFPPGKSLIDTFYDDAEVFMNWYGDAVTDCYRSPERLNVIRTTMACVKINIENLQAQLERNSTKVFDTHSELERYYATLGAEVFRGVDSFIRAASKVASGE